jgi:dihydrofolate synthase / folylpolyglutamate synthase
MAGSELEEAEKLLLGLFDFERARLAQKKLKPFTTERVREALRSRSINPESRRPIIHLAGTKGKGSVAWLLHWALSERYERVGLFSSPHLISLRERIRIGDQLVGVKEMKARAEVLHRLNQDSFDGELTFFEFLFLMAMEEFAEAQCPWVILETGMGGRLDATNAVASRLSVLTRIDYDHMEFLGNTLESIAGEKAGIVKDGGEVVALKQSQEVNEVFEAVCRKKGAKLHWVVPEAQGAAGENLALAKEVLNCIGEDSAVLDRVTLNLPGRFQEVEVCGAKLILDSAHNPLSLSVLSSHLQSKSSEWEGAFAMAEGREVEDMLRPLLRSTNKLNVFELPGGRPGLSPEQILRVWISMGGEGELKDDLGAWLKSSAQNPRYLTGSFYLVGEALKELGFQAEELWPQPI